LRVGVADPSNRLKENIMEEMLWRRRVAVAASVLALGGFGVAATGCGDNNGDSEDIENAADDAVQEGENAAEDVGDAADEATDDAGKALEGDQGKSESKDSGDDGY
jgi:hypothetical protein